ncbi:MAG: hypothetical protein ABGY42_09200 [bacterium]
MVAPSLPQDPVAGYRDGMEWMRWIIWAVLGLFAASSLWLILSGTLGERVDAKRAARAAEKAAAAAPARLP